MNNNFPALARIRHRVAPALHHRTQPIGFPEAFSSSICSPSLTSMGFTENANSRSTQMFTV
ncbi:MAG: hypothetical protein QNJ36_09315 [Calothrix sp. MO_167.B42]|nr:hypothetical protein [Calothrix sp. MO_167.B42]